MRPDRIIIGEVRGEEAFDMLQAMNTGHEGSMTTIHANTPRDAISRMESMVAMTNMNLPEKSVRQQIASAISIIVQATRQSDGTRKVTSVAEIWKRTSSACRRSLRSRRKASARTAV
jgi:pilus assembly protein CpaF